MTARRSIRQKNFTSILSFRTLVWLFVRLHPDTTGTGIPTAISLDYTLQYNECPDRHKYLESFSAFNHLLPSCLLIHVRFRLCTQSALSRKSSFHDARRCLDLLSLSRRESFCKRTRSLSCLPAFPLRSMQAWTKPISSVARLWVYDRPTSSDVSPTRLEPSASDTTRLS